MARTATAMRRAGLLLACVLVTISHGLNGGTRTARRTYGRRIPVSSVAVRAAPDNKINEESLRWYLSSIGKHNLLSVSDESVLSHDVQELTRWNSVREQLEQTLSRPPTKGEWSRAVGFEEALRSPEYAEMLEARCFDSQLQQLRQAKETMINSNLRLVVTIAKRYANRGVNIQDLIQEGTLGLITAVDKFDPTHHSQAKFSSYASWWIKQRLSRAVGKSGTIRLPARMPSLIATVQSAKEDFVTAVGRDPSAEELASSVGISVSRLNDVLKAMRDPVSLDREFAASNDDSRTLKDMLPCKEASPSTRLERRMMRQTLAKALHAVLDAEEHSVICSAYDLIEDRGVPLQYEEIGKRFGMDADWAKKIEARAMRKLKNKPHLRNLLAKRDLDGYYAFGTDVGSV